VEPSINTCPSCGDTNFQPLIKLKDWFLTKQPFSLEKCSNCGLVVTFPVPELSSLSKYYKSDQYISHAESTGIIARVYRAVQLFTLNQKLRLIRRLSNSQTLLDYGAGKGDFLNHCQRHGLNVYGCEPDSDARAIAQKKNGLSLSPSLSAVDNIQFDLVTLWHVLEHIPDPQIVVKNLVTRLNSGGLLIVAVPNHDCFDADFYGKFWAAYDVPRHLTHFNPSAMNSFAEECGLAVESMHRMWFDATYVSLLSEKLMAANGKGLANFIGIVRALSIGFISNTFSLFNKKKCSSIIYVLKRQERQANES
jgi:SAM-dependent methyltransferase